MLKRYGVGILFSILLAAVIFLTVYGYRLTHLDGAETQMTETNSEETLFY